MPQPFLQAQERLSTTLRRIDEGCFGINSMEELDFSLIASGNRRLLNPDGEIGRLCSDFVIRWIPEQSKIRVSLIKGRNHFAVRWLEFEEKIFFFVTSKNTNPTAVRDLKSLCQKAVYGTMTRTLGENLSQIDDGWIFVQVRRESFSVSRDPLGIMTCSFSRTKSNGLSISSSPGFLAANPTAFSRSRLASFLLDARDQGRDDFWQGVRRLFPGETLLVSSEGKMHFQKWWSFTVTEEAYLYSDTSQRLADLLEEKIESYQWSSTFTLSGGIDSSMLAVIASETHRRFQTASLVSKDFSDFDESDDISRIATDLGVLAEYFDINEISNWNDPLYFTTPWSLGPSAFLENGYMLPFLFIVGERLGPGSIIFGVGADEIFSISRKDYFRRAPSGLEKMLGLKIPVRTNLKKLIKKLLKEPETRICKGPWLIGTSHEELTEQAASNFQARRFCSWLWELVGRTVDRYQRCTGLDIRLPYATPKIVSLGLRLDVSDLRNSEKTKLLQRRYLEDRLQKAIVEKKKAGSFSSPILSGIQQGAAILGTKDCFLLEELEFVRRGTMGSFLEALNYQIPTGELGRLSRLITTEIWLRKCASLSVSPFSVENRLSS